MVIPTLMWFTEPRLFLEVNYDEICKMVSYMCQMRPNISPYEDEVRFLLIDRCLKGYFKYDPQKHGPLTSYVNKMVWWSIRRFMSSKPEGFFEYSSLEGMDFGTDPQEALDVALDYQRFEQEVSRIKRTTSVRKVEGNVYLKVLRMKKAGYLNTEIKKKLGVTDMYISIISKRLRRFFKEGKVF